LRKRSVAPFLACLTLAVPASASAHAKSPTVALDYRLVLDRGSRDLGGVHVGILDGDRSLRVTAGSRPLVVLGDLHEPMLRIGATGAWANRASVTAVAARLVSAGSGWKHVGGSTFAWHDHRLAPPPYDSGRSGVAARFRIPVRIGSHETAIGGSFVRYRRPQAWPWAVAAGAGLAAALAAVRLAPRRRPLLTVALGTLAGLAAVASLASFGVADSPTGRVAWVELGLALFVACAAAIALVRAHGGQRMTLAALIGAAAAATTLGSLGVFRHAVVISSLPPFLARTLCALAFTAGLGAAATGLLARVEA
jgi:hypothetical protein